jgi:hypothetical protein
MASAALSEASAIEKAELMPFIPVWVFLYFVDLIRPIAVVVLDHSGFGREVGN